MVVKAEDILDTMAEELRLDRAHLCPSARLDTLDIGSMDVVTLMTALEARYGVHVDQQDIAEAETLQDFLDVVVAKAGA